MAELAMSVVSTKALTLQLTVLACLAIVAAWARHAINRNRELGLSAALIDVSGQANEMLTSNHRLREIAQECAKTQEALFVERGISYPIALEGAVKLREITDIHAKGYSAGAMKYGCVPLIAEDIPKCRCALGGVFEKSASNLQAIAARGGEVPRCPMQPDSKT